MNNLVPERRMNKNGVWSTKHVRPENSSNTLGVHIPRIKMADAFNDIHGALARGAVQQLVINQIEDGATLESVDGKDFGEACLDKFMTFSNETLTLIASYGVNAEYAEDARYEYTCMEMLVSSGALEADFVNVLKMSDYLTETHDIVDPDEHVALCLALKLYDPYIAQHAGTDTSSVEARLPYYEALIGTTLAIEIALGAPYAQIAEEGYDEDGPTTPLLYSQLVPRGNKLPSSPVIDDQKLLEIVLRNIDRNDEINTLIKARKTTDPAILDEYVNNSHQAIAKGVL